MDWFEQVKDTVKKTAGVAYDKSEQLVDIAKIKLALVSAENEAEKLYKELGLLCYEQNKGKENSDLVSNVIEKIDAKHVEIAELKGNVAKNKKVKLCDKCGKEVSPESVFCSYCGEKF